MDSFGAKWADKLKASAEAAAEAARAFQGFDDMAAKDDYIHSDSLNVKRQRGHKSSPSKVVQETSKATPSHAESSSFISNLMSSMENGASLTTPTAVASNTARSSRESMPLLRSVQQTIETHDSDEEDDPIWASLRHRSDAASSTSSVSSDTSNQELDGASERKKNKRRFLEDLEQRTSRVNAITGTEPSPVAATAAATAQQQQISSWMSTWGLRSSNTNKPEIASPGLPPLARRPKVVAAAPPVDDDFHIVVSSNVLAVDELKELAAIRSERSLWQLTRQHPREFFVILTLVLGVLAYLFGQWFSVPNQ